MTFTEPLADHLAALRAQGLPGAARSRLAQLEALLARSANQPPAVREVLLARVQAGVSDLLARHPVLPSDPPRQSTPIRPQRVRGAAQERAASRQTAQPAGAGTVAPPGRSAGLGALPEACSSRRPTDELAAVRDFRRAWAAQRLDDLLVQTRAQRPANAGPLNSQALVQELMAALQSLSQPYLQRFVVQVDSLIQLEQLLQTMAPAPARRERRATPPLRRRD